VAPGAVFELTDYFNHPEKYRSQFERHLPHLSVLVNGIYWDQRYPRLVTKTYLKRRWSENNPLRLQVIGDISCDIHGSIECTEKATASDQPCFTYHPLSGAVVDGIDGEGIVLMAVDNLPAEIPRDSSEAFGQTLAPFIPALAQAELRRPFAQLALPPEIKNAIICHQGELVPDYAYLQQHLTQS
jgi:alpha-aminoadipic semialdehyde synthase